MPGSITSRVRNCHRTWQRTEPGQTKDGLDVSVGLFVALRLEQIGVKLLVKHFYHDQGLCVFSIHELFRLIAIIQACDLQSSSQPDMEDSESRRRARYITMLAVMALHAALVAMLVKFDGIRSAATLTSSAIQVRFLPPVAAPVIRPGSPLELEGSFKEFNVAAPTLPSLTLVPMVSSEDDSSKSVDWAAEARIVAAASAMGVPHRAFGSHVPPGTVSSPGAGPSPSPAHKAGDQYRTEDGDWAVFVTKNCYQISKSIPNLFSSILRALPLQTYCLGKSKQAPRGDLFEQLPAYKKYHPGQ